MVTQDTTQARTQARTQANNAPALSGARNVLSQEELDFLLSPQTGEEPGAGTDGKGIDGKGADAAQKGVAGAGAHSRKIPLTGKKKDRGSILPDARPHAAEGGPAASCPDERERKRFFAVALERSLRRATGTFVGIRFDGDRTLSPKALDELAGAPACFVEIASKRGAGIVFCLDNRAAQALVNASLGQGRGPARTEGPLSLFDRELVRRSLNELGEAFAQAFDCPCAACVRLAWHADEMFQAASGKQESAKEESEMTLCAAEFSMETCGRPGTAWLFAPKHAA